MTITLPDIDHEVDAAIEQLITDLTNARDYIDKHGLLKNTYASSVTNARCLDGAIMAAIGYSASCDPRRDRALFALAVTLGFECNPRGAVYEFNDADETTKDDAVALIGVTIDRLRA